MNLKAEQCNLSTVMEKRTKKNKKQKTEPLDLWNNSKQCKNDIQFPKFLLYLKFCDFVI